MKIDDETRFKEHWRSFVVQSGIEPFVATRMYKLLVPVYMSRAYHNLNHISRVIETINTILLSDFGGPKKFSAGRLRLAAFLHDYIYVPGAGDNEQRSSLCAEVFCFALDVEDWSYDVKGLIMQTTHEKPDPDEVSAIIRDADLEGLADPFDDFCATGDAIRAEFEHVEHNEFLIGRRKWMQHMLQKPKIFHTKWGQQLERAARKNLSDWCRGRRAGGAG